jgi:hypothetical protein
MDEVETGRAGQQPWHRSTTLNDSSAARGLSVTAHYRAARTARSFNEA